MGFVESGLFRSNKTFAGNFFDPLGLTKAFSGQRKETVQSTLQPSVPQVSNEAAAQKRKRRIGRSALIATEQEDILGDPPTLGRNVLTAI